MKIEKTGTLGKLMFTGQLNKFIIYLIASVLAAVCFIMALLVYLEIVKPLVITDISIGTPIDFILFAVFLSTGTFGIYEFMCMRRIRKIDDRFPDFVRGLAESRRAGMTFTKAIMYSAKGNYGVLTSEIKKIAQQISWGSSVDDALNAFARRINTKLIRRTISLIIEASRSGGNVADVLDAASKDARELKLLERERRAAMLSYIIVIYVGMGVFLMIIVILCNMFIPHITGGTLVGSAQITSSQITESEIANLFFVSALFQSFGMGMVAGVFEESKVVSGVKHIFVLVLITWIVFKSFVGGV